MKKMQASAVVGAALALGQAGHELPIGSRSILATCSDRQCRRFRTFRDRAEMEAEGWTIRDGRVVCRQCGGAR